MEKNQETFIEKHGMKLGVAIGILLAGTLAYFSYQAGQTEQEPEEEQNLLRASTRSESKPKPVKKDPSPISNNSPAYVTKITSLREKIPQELRRGELDMGTIIQIHEALIDISKADFGKCIVHNRTQRREVRGKDDAEYERLVVQGATEIEQLISRKIQEVLKDAGCTMALYESSCQSWANKNPQFAMMSILMIEKMKTEIPSKVKQSDLTIQRAIDMMKFQIQEYPRIKVQVQNRQVMPLVKQSWLGDVTAEKFGFEEEDISRVDGLAQNNEVRQLAQQLQTLMQMDAFSMMGGGM